MYGRYSLPETRPPNASGVRAASLGAFEFRTANQIDFRPPQMAQWSLTIDRQIAGSTGLRLSYIGNKSSQLPWAPDINQPQPSTTFFSQRPLTDRPFPNWGLIYSRCRCELNLQFVPGGVTRRFERGLTYNVAYTLAKNLADNNGPAPTGYPGETGGGRVMNSLDRRADRGDVYATRRHRFVNTLVYDLPFGRGRKLMSASNRFIDGVFGG